VYRRTYDMSMYQRGAVKAQGQNFLDQVVLDLGKDEKEHGLAYSMLLFLMRYDLPTLV
jgi:hypothetical protein